MRSFVYLRPSYVDYGTHSSKVLLIFPFQCYYCHNDFKFFHLPYHFGVFYHSQCLPNSLTYEIVDFFDYADYSTSLTSDLIQPDTAFPLLNSSLTCSDCPIFL